MNQRIEKARWKTRYNKTHSQTNKMKIEPQRMKIV